MATHARGPRIVDIEALRAFAILLVFQHHLLSDLITWGSWPETVRHSFNGGVGVDLFLVVSGFVIGRSLVPRLRAAGSTRVLRSTVIAFWIRRFWRLIPSAWLWLLVPVLLSLLFNRSGAFGTPHGNVLAATAALFQVANFHFAWALSQQDPELQNSVFVYWSLSLEEQFYLLLPFLVLLSRRALPVVLAVLVLVQLGLDRDVFRVFFVRTDGLFTGVLLSLWQGRASYRSLEPVVLDRRGVRALFVIGSLVALSSVGARDSWLPHGYRHVGKLLFATPLVWAASYDRDYVVRAGWMKRAAYWLGARSYSLYLIHIPVFFLTREIFYRLDPTVPVRAAGPLGIGLFLATAGVLSAALSDLNFRIVEVPLRRRGREISRVYLAKRDGS